MAKEEQAPAEQPEGGGSKKKLFIIIGAAVGLAVVLGLVFMMMGKGDKKPKKEGEAAPAADAHGAPAPAPAAAPAAGAHGAPAAGGAAAAPGANNFQLEPFVVNIYDGQELRYLKVKVELEMTGAAVKAELEGKLPPIRDAILTLLSTKTLRDVLDTQGRNQMKEEILASINKIIPPGKIAKVYFTDFVVQ